MKVDIGALAIDPIEKPTSGAAVNQQIFNLQTKINLEKQIHVKLSDLGKWQIDKEEKKYFFMSRKHSTIWIAEWLTTKDKNKKRKQMKIGKNIFSQKPVSIGQHDLFLDSYHLRNQTVRTFTYVPDLT